MEIEIMSPAEYYLGERGRAVCTAVIILGLIVFMYCAVHIW
jgi:hypothetical protein